MKHKDGEEANEKERFRKKYTQEDEIINPEDWACESK